MSRFVPSVLVGLVATVAWCGSACAQTLLLDAAGADPLVPPAEDGYRLPWRLVDPWETPRGGGFCLARDELLQAGWWFSATRGSPARVARYQDLAPAPFWSVDLLRSQAERTSDLFLAGLDQEATDVFLKTYDPSLRADLRYQRYIDRTEPDRLLNFAQIVADHAQPGSDPEPSGFLAEDLHVGADYALRVQQLKARLQGTLSERAKWRVTVWGLRKAGERQALALSNAHDRPDRVDNCQACHVLSQRQEIDWQTIEVTPAVEARRGPVTVSLSLPFRSFYQNDELVTRLYNAPPANHGGRAVPPQLGSEAFPAGAEYPYAVVPESFTQIRQLRVGVDLPACTKLNASLYQGSTDNRFRDTRRRFLGGDLRLTDRSRPAVTWTAFAKVDHKDHALPAELISGERLEFDRYDERVVPCDEDASRYYGGCGCVPPSTSCVLGSDGVPDFFARDALVEPVDYTWVRFGANGRWKPYWRARSWRRGLTCYGRYEFRLLQRGHAEFEAAVAPGETIVFRQGSTRRHLVQLGASQHWSPTFDSFVRLRTWYESDPLYGVRETNGTTNSMLPQHADMVEVGGTWSPAAWLIASGTLAVESRDHDSGVAEFDQRDYPLTLSAWYAPAARLWFSIGYACCRRRIGQAITLGDDLVDSAPYAPATTWWAWGGQDHVGTLGCVYAWSPRLRLRSDVKLVSGDNRVDTSRLESSEEWPGIEQVVRTSVRSVRVSAGFDYALRRRVNGYLRYSYLDYEDAVVDYRSGTAHLLLTGLSGTY